MRSVWKFEVPVDDEWHSLKMPLPARVFHVGCQRPGVVAIWAEVTPGSDEFSTRSMRAFGTGQEVEGTYVGTAIDRSLVWHVYAEPTS